jgi:Uma2 family endonuclease
MTLPVSKRRYTIQEYLKLEEAATDRHEFHDGEVLAMSGGTDRHSGIGINIVLALGNRLRGHPCRLRNNDLRVRIPGQARYLYPDASIICGPTQLDEDDPKKTTIINPRVIVEVLSDSTEAYDRGAKFEFYRAIPSLEEYVLVSQREPMIETFLRQPGGTWLFNAWKGLETIASLKSIKIELPLAEVYYDDSLGKL